MAAEEMMDDKNLVIATHSGSAHADDVVGVAVLRHLHPHAGLLRTRDPEAIAAADFAVDVGGVWDPASGRFDHHQKGFAGQRSNGTVYASAGLVWAAHGNAFVRSLKPAMPDVMLERVVAAIDYELMEHVDRADTGAAQGAPGYFGLSAILSSFNLTREEEEAWGQELLDQVRMDRFLESTAIVQRLLSRLVAQFSAQFADEALVRQAERLHGGQVLVLDRSGLDWEPVVMGEMPEVLFVVYPDSTDQQFQVRTVREAKDSFKARKDLPAAWAGLRDAELSAVIGIPDAVFCHNGRFIGGAGSKQSALTMARLAVES